MREENERMRRVEPEDRDTLRAAISEGQNKRRALGEKGKK